MLVQLEIDFEVFKALTARRLNERHTYNDIIRELLGLDSLIESPDPVEGLFDDSGPVTPRPVTFASLVGSRGPTGFSARGIFLPNGTLIKAIYKQQIYTAKIDGGCWVDAQGVSHKSPSAAAKNVTGSNVNGLRFWRVKRPDDAEWRRLDLLKW